MAAYVDGRLSGESKATVEQHLVSCHECVDEVSDLRAVLESGRPRWRRLAIPLTAAAAALLLIALPSDQFDVPDSHRDRPPVAAVERPVGVAPVGPIDSVVRFEWRRVEGADRYRVTLFDSTGVVLWSSSTADTIASVPDSVALEPTGTYLWQIEARLGFDRWLASELERFEVLPAERER